MSKIVCHDLDNKKFEVDSSKLIFRPSIYGILIEDGKILLSKQFDGYDLPGGGINIHETLEEALKREFFEETGIKIEPLQPVHCETSFFTPNHSEKNKNQFWNCPMIYFLVKKVGGEISKDNFDEEEKNYADLAEWIDIEKTNQIKFISSADINYVTKKAVELFKK